MLAAFWVVFLAPFRSKNYACGGANQVATMVGDDVRTRGERREGQQKKVILARAINNMIRAVACSQQLQI